MCEDENTWEEGQPLSPDEAKQRPAVEWHCAAVLRSSIARSARSLVARFQGRMKA